MKFKLFLPLMALVFIAASCSKEKRVERRLTRKDGKWNIAEWTYATTANGTTTSETYANAGSMTFDDNTVVWQISIDGDSETLAGTWTNTEDKLTIISDGSAVVFDIEDESRKEMTLKYTDSYTWDGSTTTDVVTLKLKKD